MHVVRHHRQYRPRCAHQHSRLGRAVLWCTAEYKGRRNGRSHAEHTNRTIGSREQIRLDTTDPVFKEFGFIAFEGTLPGPIYQGDLAPAIFSFPALQLYQQVLGDF